jgi:hypothetical protein
MLLTMNTWVILTASTHWTASTIDCRKDRLALLRQPDE